MHFFFYFDAFAEKLGTTQFSKKKKQILFHTGGPKTEETRPGLKVQLYCHSGTF